MLTTIYNLEKMGGLIFFSRYDSDQIGWFDLF
jgi:hypothetical protein